MRRTTSARTWRLLTTLFAVLALAVTASLSAQIDVTTSRVSGFVKSKDGATLPGATVTAPNRDTGLLKTAVSDKNGFYQLLDLPTGTYKLEAHLDGFTPLVAETIRVSLGSAPTIDFTLIAVRVSESVTVSAQAAGVEVTNTTISETIQTEQLKNLPTPGRDFKNLVLLTPATGIESQRNYIQISGQRAINTNITVDGVDYNDPFFGGNVGSAEGRAPLSMSQESIKEFTRHHQRRLGRVRPVGRRLRQRRHEERHEHAARLGLLLRPAAGLDLRLRSQCPVPQRPATGRPEQVAVRRLVRRPDRQGQALLLRIVRQTEAEHHDTDQPDGPRSRHLREVAGSREPDPVRAGRATAGSASAGSTGRSMDSQRLLARVNYADYNGPNGTNSSANDTLQHNGIEAMKSLSGVGTWSSQFGANFAERLQLQLRPRVRAAPGQGSRTCPRSSVSSRRPIRRGELPADRLDLQALRGGGHVHVPHV